MNSSSHVVSLPQRTEAEDVAVRAYRLLDSLQTAHLTELTAFCAWELCLGCRLAGAARELMLKESADLLHDALEAVLLGFQNPDKGYHPNAEDVENLDAFLRYLRKVVRGLRLKQATLAALRAEINVPPLVGTELHAIAQANPAEEVELSDFKHEFFKIMRHHLNNSEKYAAALEIWHEDFFHIDRLTQLGLNTIDTCSLQLNAQWLYSRLSRPVPDAGTPKSLVAREFARFLGSTPVAQSGNPHVAPNHEKITAR